MLFLAHVIFIIQLCFEETFCIVCGTSCNLVPGVVSCSGDQAITKRRNHSGEQARKKKLSTQGKLDIPENWNNLTTKFHWFLVELYFYFLILIFYST